MAFLGAMFSQSLATYDSGDQLAPMSASASALTSVARRQRFNVGGRRDDRMGDCDLRQQQYCLHVPKSVRCPDELSPIGSALGSSVPFAAALNSVRSRCLPVGVTFNSDDFEWVELDQANNSSGESSSRKVAAKESAKRDIDNYFFMYFRVRMENFVALVTALKQSSKDESIFNDENLDRWTHKYKFKIKRASPLKKALMAFSSRMGLENDPDVMYCADGFYGDSFSGRTYNKNEVPNNRVLPANTSLATGLRNGSNVFVSRITNAERNSAIAQLQMDLLRGNEPSDEEGDEAQTTPEQKSESKDDTGDGKTQ